jgi:tetratricopeptide (TPR) repeat protein
LVKRQQYDLALREASSALAHVPDSSVALGVVAYCHLRKGQMSEAKDVAWQAVQCNAHEAGAHYVLAETFIAERKLTEAEKHLRIALSVKPDVETYLEALGRVLNSTDREDEAIAIANEILRGNSNDVDALI